MRVGIIGTGAMATLFAARLRSVADVVLIGSWQTQIEALNTRGLLLDELDGRQTQHLITATDDPHSVPPVDVALILTKSYQTIEAVERTQAALASGGIVITLQNGLGNLDRFVDAFGRNRCTLGVTTVGATLLRPGHLRHAGRGLTHIAIPPYLPATAHTFVRLLRSAGLLIELVEQANSLLWSKVAINTGINPLTAIFNVPNGQLAADPTLRKLMIAAAVETATVAAAQNVTITYPDVSKAVVHIAEATALNRSSMLQDVERGAPTEIDAMCGAVVRFGRMLNVSTPINSLLYQALIDLESGQTRPVLIKRLQLRANSLQ